MPRYDEENLAELRTRFNQQRQTAITEELMDVITGFEALSNDRR
jgi:F-type H+-transporting ATPase subunit gamma